LTVKVKPSRQKKKVEELLRPSVLLDGKAKLTVIAFPFHWASAQVRALPYSIVKVLFVFWLKYETKGAFVIFENRARFSFSH